MKHLTIIRHAKSSWSSAAESDFDRPLNARGLRTAPQMAQHLNENIELRPDYAVSSSAVRAISTARIIAPALGIEESEIVQNGGIYDAELQALLYAVRKIPGTRQNALLFGHMPGVAGLVHFLSGSVPDHFPTCGVAMLELNVAHWSDANLSCGKLNAFLYPKMLEA